MGSRSDRDEKSLGQTWPSISLFLHGDRIGPGEMTKAWKRNKERRQPWFGVTAEAEDKVLRTVEKWFVRDCSHANPRLE